MSKVPARSLGGLMFVALLSGSSPLLAAGDEALGLAYHEAHVGLGVASAGVGLSGRRANLPTVPTSSANLVLDSLPAGAVIEQAFLYWSILGTGDDTLSIDGQPVKGQLIGTAANTCWEVPTVGAKNL